jgi:hypothetical protein
MCVKRVALIILCGLLAGAGSKGALIFTDSDTSSMEQRELTFRSVTAATDFGFLIEDLRALSGCAESARCRWTGRAIPWWTYDKSGTSLDTTNVLAPESGTHVAGDARFFVGSAPPAGILALGNAL